MNMINILTNRVLRKMGYFDDRRGLADRYASQAEAWDEHLQNSRNFVKRVLEGRQIDNLIIMGSGWLIDLPPGVICQMAGNIYLYDIAHPSQIIHEIRRYGNIKAVTADVTGGSILAAYQAVQKYRRTGIRTEIGKIFQTGFQPDVHADFMISLCLLSQLGSLISEYLVKYIPYDNNEIMELNRLIESEHIRLLKRVPSCLITDYEEVLTDLHSGGEEIRKSIHIDVPQSGQFMKWDWHFDMDGSYYPGKKVLLKVLATEIHSDGVPPRQGVKETLQFF
ncbi:MAG: hypothetical protein JXB19_06800 [Bacteroidales bacterium]|nr:hypothetical protein [Bacteroidales bacterium]